MRMRFKNIFIIFLILILTSNFAIAQKTPAKKDSTKIYKNIETYSRQSRFKSFAYGLVFKPVTAISSKSSVKKKTYKKLIQKPYSSFEGKPIRNIYIVTLDPFGMMLHLSSTRIKISIESDFLPAVTT